jgi:hypothetical protein
MLIALFASSCSKTYDKMEMNPNNPESVPASLVLNGVEASLAPGAWGFQQEPVLML